MIPTRDELVEAYAAIALRQNLEALARRRSLAVKLPLEASPTAIDSARAMAAKLLETEIHPAAALLYAFARHPRCFPVALHLMTTLVAQNAANDVGVRLIADKNDLKAIVNAVMHQELGPDDVDAWVRDRLVELPTSGSARRS